MSKFYLIPPPSNNKFNFIDSLVFETDVITEGAENPKEAARVLINKILETEQDIFEEAHYFNMTDHNSEIIDFQNQIFTHDEFVLYFKKSFLLTLSTRTYIVDKDINTDFLDDFIEKYNSNEIDNEIDNETIENFILNEKLFIVRSLSNKDNYFLFVANSAIEIHNHLKENKDMILSWEHDIEILFSSLFYGECLNYQVSDLYQAVLTNTEYTFCVLEEDRHIKIDS